MSRSRNRNGGPVVPWNPRVINVFAPVAAEVVVPLAQVFVRPDDEDLGWMDLALCAEVDPELHFPEKGGSTREAKSVCASCDVRAECLEYALEHPEVSRFGVWGGVSERARRQMARDREQQPPAPAPSYPLCDAGLHPMEPGNVHINLKTSLPACTTCRDIARTRAPLAMVTPIFVWTREAMKTRAA